MAEKLKVGCARPTGGVVGTPEEGPKEETLEQQKKGIEAIR